MHNMTSCRVYFTLVPDAAQTDVTETAQHYLSILSRSMPCVTRLHPSSFSSCPVYDATISASDVTLPLHAHLMVHPWYDVYPTRLVATERPERSVQVALVYQWIGGAASAAGRSIFEGCE